MAAHTAIENYKLVWGADLPAVEAAVVALMEDESSDWEPLGPIQAVARHPGYQMFVQTMVEYDQGD